MQRLYYDAYRHTASVHGVDRGTRDLLNALVERGRMTKPQLQHLLGVGDRTVRKRVELARRAGVPVMSSSGEAEGYWLPTTIEEIDGFLHHEIRSRIASLADQENAILATREAIRQATPREVVKQAGLGL